MQSHTTPILIACLVLAFAFGLLIVAVLYNDIIRNANRITRAWADVITHERQKIKILEPLKVQVADFKEYESGLLEKITKIRTDLAELNSGSDHGQLAKLQRDTQALIAGVRVAVEAYPQLQTGHLFTSLMREITEQEENVGASIKIYNAAVERYNNSIQSIWGSPVNTLLTKKRAADSFQDSQASSGIGFTPNTL
jgi:LemA protein